MNLKTMLNDHVQWTIANGPCVMKFTEDYRQYSVSSNVTFSIKTESDLISRTLY